MVLEQRDKQLSSRPPSSQPIRTLGKWSGSRAKAKS